MNYTKIYKNIIENARTKNENYVGYLENHHIIPKCVGGGNESTNLVKLTAKEHYVAHHLLMKIYQVTKYYSKMICAFRFMSVDSHNGNRVGLRDYENMRRLFSENHPTKSDEVRIKIKNSLKLFYQSLSQEERNIRNDNFKKKLKIYFDNLSVKDKEEYRNKLSESMKKFFENETKEDKIKRKERHKLIHTKDSYLKTSKTMKCRLSKLSKEEHIDRLKKSAWSGDQKKRGESISKSKKGKTTNQQKIMGEKYAKMSDDQFYEFIKGRNEKIKIRMTKLRERYFND